jgi:hypothetical protein
LHLAVFGELGDSIDDGRLLVRHELSHRRIAWKSYHENGLTSGSGLNRHGDDPVGEVNRGFPDVLPPVTDGALEIRLDFSDLENYAREDRVEMQLCYPRVQVSVNVWRTLFGDPRFAIV